MSTALDRVINTVELLEHMLLLLPLDLLLRARQVSRLWRELILRSERFRKLHSEPYIGISLQLPAKCSLSDSNEPRLMADLTLYFDEPVTMRQKPSCLHYPSQLTYRHEVGTPPPDSFPPFDWAGCFRARAFKFNHKNKEMWTTLYPGVVYMIYLRIRPGPRSNRTQSSGSLGKTEVGKTYVLKLRPGYKVGVYVGVKETLLARKENGEALKASEFEKSMLLHGENQVMFTVIS